MNYLLLSGSFHSTSRSLAILNHIASVLTDHDVAIPRLDALPFYSDDLSDNKPEAVTQLIDQIAAADGLIFCTPEYNHSVPAVLKNAIDWASRPAFQSVLKDKPITIITQAPSPVGGARAQAHLKLILDSTLSRIHPVHEMLIPHVDTIFDEAMNITDKKVITRLQRHIDDFAQFVGEHQ